MRRNPRRRSALVNAAIEVLARDGARGLTFRAVDAAADVPAGTASNYFPTRDELLHQAGTQVHERLGPDPTELARTLRTPPSRELVTLLMRQLIDRILDDRVGYLALLELRLEAARQPRLHAALAQTLRANLDFNIRNHADLGMPGDQMSVVTLYLAISGLVVELLTVPEVMDRFDLDDLVAELVARAIPDDGNRAAT
ncbi:MAG: TetR/AcrR family transcriptional regulator [Stackebrandtia sp.]